MAGRIAPKRAPEQRRPRMKSPAYLRHLGTLPCMACGKEGESVAAHIRTGNEGGTGLKPDDWLTVPLCHACHMDQENNPGPEWWMERVLKPWRERAYGHWRLNRKIGG